ncbi:MAG: ABC transporter permease [Clostridia bacterium]|nr:ABC transporter permease [Clostridia bacterium]
MRFIKYLRFFCLLVKLKLNRQMMYSFNFWMVLFVDLSLFAIQIAVFSAIFLQVDTINGWNRNQMIFFIGTFTILDSIYMSTYFFGVIGIPDKILTGKLDIYISKPVNTLFFVSFESIDLGSLLLLFPGIMMITYSTAMMGITVTVWGVLGYVFLIVLMLVLMFDLMIIIRSTAFWFTRIDSLSDFENEMVNFSFRVPGVVFKGVSKLVFYVILPYGLMATIPTQFFTGLLDGWTCLLTITVCFVFTLLSQRIWKLGLKHYGSASS